MAKKIYTSGNENISKEVKRIYTAIPSSTAILKNLCPAINGTNGFSIGGGTGESSTTYTKYSLNSLKLTGNTSNAEITATSTATLSLNSKHIYYARIEAYQETLGGGIDIYWPIAEPNMFSHGNSGVAKEWILHSAVVNRSSFEDGNYAFRLDFNNNKTANTIWYDGWMIIDLTDAFGPGNEPNKEWCDENIPYFEGTHEVDRPKTLGIAARVIKGYVGVKHTLQVLDYLESSGTQFIDTGITANQNIKVEMKFENLENSKSTHMFGSRPGWNDSAIGISFANESWGARLWFFMG